MEGWLFRKLDAASAPRAVTDQSLPWFHPYPLSAASPRPQLPALLQNSPQGTGAPSELTLVTICTQRAGLGTGSAQFGCRSRECCPAVATEAFSQPRAPGVPGRDEGMFLLWIAGSSVAGRGGTALQRGAQPLRSPTWELLLRRTSPTRETAPRSPSRGRAEQRPLRSSRAEGSPGHTRPLAASGHPVPSRPADSAQSAAGAVLRPALLPPRDPSLLAARGDVGWAIARSDGSLWGTRPLMCGSARVPGVSL